MYKQLLFCLCLLCGGSQLFAQIDVGLNLLSVPKPQLTVEKNINEHLSIIGGIGFGVGQQTLDLEIRDSLFQSLITIGEEGRFPPQNIELDAFLGLRYYFFPDEQFKGLFTGGSLMYQTTVWVDPIYDVEKPSDNFLLRIPVGYKWVSPKGIMIEAGCVIIAGKEIYNSFGLVNHIDVRLGIIGKIGYRFGGKTNA